MSSEGLEPLVTQCPNCDTRFRVTEAQLQAASGRVRCGACLAVFEATQHLTMDGEELAPAQDEDVDALLDELDEIKSREPDELPKLPKIAGEDLGTRSQAELDADPEEALPDELLALEAQLLDEMRETTQESAQESIQESAQEEVLEMAGEIESPDMVEVSTAPDPQREEVAEPDAQWAEDVADDIWGDASDGADAAASKSETAPSKVTHETPEPNSETDADSVEETDAVVPDEQAEVAHEVPPLLEPINEFEALHLQDEEQETQKTPWLTYAMIVVALIALPAQVLWFQFDSWVLKPELRPIYQSLCNLGGCELPPLRDVSQIVSRKVVIRAHPEKPDIRVIDILMVNNAPFEQPYPLIELMATGVRKQLVAGRRFTPAEYLKGDAANEQLIPPRTPVHVTVEIDKPGVDALTFEVTFR